VTCSNAGKLVFSGLSSRPMIFDCLSKGESHYIALEPV